MAAVGRCHPVLGTTRHHVTSYRFLGVGDHATLTRTGVYHRSDGGRRVGGRNVIERMDALDARAYRVVLGAMQTERGSVDDSSCVVTHTQRARAVGWTLVSVLGLAGVLGVVLEPALLGPALPVLVGAGRLVWMQQGIISVTFDGLGLALPGRPAQRWSWDEVESVEVIRRGEEPDVRVWFHGRRSPLMVSGPGLRATGGSAAEVAELAARQAGVPVIPGLPRPELDRARERPRR